MMGRIGTEERWSLKRRMRGMSRMVMIWIGSTRLLRITRMGRRGKRFKRTNRKDKVRKRVRKSGVKKQRCLRLRSQRNKPTRILMTNQMRKSNNIQMTNHQRMIFQVTKKMRRKNRNFLIKRMTLKSKADLFRSLK